MFLLFFCVFSSHIRAVIATVADNFSYKHCHRTVVYEHLRLCNLSGRTGQLLLAYHPFIHVAALLDIL